MLQNPYPQVSVRPCVQRVRASLGLSGQSVRRGVRVTASLSVQGQSEVGGLDLAIVGGGGEPDGLVVRCRSCHSCCQAASIHTDLRGRSDPFRLVRDLGPCAARCSSSSDSRASRPPGGSTSASQASHRPNDRHNHDQESPGSCSSLSSPGSPGAWRRPSDFISCGSAYACQPYRPK